MQQAPDVFRGSRWAVGGLALALLFTAPAFAQSPELSLREFASGQIKKGVRVIGFGADGATWGNYDLGKARVGELFGPTSHSVLATFTFDMTWRSTSASG